MSTKNRKMTCIIHSSFLEKYVFFLIILFCFVPQGSCTGKIENERNNVNNVIYKLIEADNNSDMETILNSYTDSVEFYPTGRAFIKGINSVKTNYENLFKENTLSITTEIIETKIIDGNALVTGVNMGIRKSTVDSTITAIDDKYIAILVLNSKGEWKIDKLIWGLDH